MLKRTLTLLLCAAMAVQGALMLNFKTNGEIEILSNGHQVGTIRGLVFRPNWNAQGFSLDISKPMEPGKFYVYNRHENLPQLDLEIAYRKLSDSKLAFECIFKPQADMQSNSINAQVVLNTEIAAGCTYTLEGQQHTFPLEFADSNLSRTKGTPLSIQSTIGTFQLTPDPKSTLLLQDNRRWNHQEFEFRMSVTPPDEQLSGESIYTWKGGQQYKVGFTLQLPEAYTVDYDTPVTIKADDTTWIPLVNKLEIEKDSAIDFTRIVNLDAPAGKYGWTKAVGQDFEFEKLPGKRQRFYGVNLCMQANILTHEQADILADRLARFGYNTVRFHHHENPIINYNKEDSTICHPDKLDAFDYLFAALKKRGIYFTTDIYVSRTVRAWEVYPGEKGEIEMTEFKRLVAVNDNAMKTWKKFAKNFLGHVNPYTGITLAEDPALNLLSMVNEGVISGSPCGNFPQKLTQQYLDAFNAWLVQHYTQEELTTRLGIKELPVKTLPGGTSPLASAYAHFLYDTHQKMFREMTSFLRDELHSKALFTDMNNAGRSIWAQSTRNSFDYVDDHFYVDHPHFLQTPWRLPSICSNTSVIRTGYIGGAGCAFLRNLDKPMCITEWDYCGPGKYRGIGGIITGCMGTIQNWAGLWRFTYSHSPSMFEPNRPATYFDLVADPLNQLTDRATICLYLRGDLKPATHTIALTFDKNWPSDKFAPNQTYDPRWYGFSLIGKVGYRMSANATDPSDIVIPFMPKAATGRETLRTDNPNSIALETELQELITKQKWLPEGNQTRPQQRRYQSADNQFMIDGATNTMILNTPMTNGGFAEAGNRIVTDIATFDVRDADATVWMSSVTDAPIRSSKRVVLNHVTEIQNTNERFAEKACKTVLAWGNTPHLLRNGSVACELTLDAPEQLTVYRLDLSGHRLAKLPTTIKNGKLCFDLHVKTPEGAQLLYELIRE